jgi:hypothetical protein
MRTCVLVVASLLGISCGGGGGRSPVAPTPVSTPAPVVIAPPPPPSVTSYAGRWFGSYIVEQCSGSSGSMGDVLCSAPRGNNPGGIFVNGTLALGSIRGSVNGSILSNQSLILSGSAIYSDAGAGFVVTNTITNWDTFLSGGALTGGFTFNVKVNVYPGDGLVRVRLSNVRR